METAEHWIDRLNLEEHPEGGYYRRTFRADRRLSPDADRRIGSSIYYLLPPGEVSRFHRLDGEEQWHFYRGSPLTLHLLDGSAGYRTRRLGSGPAHSFQTTVPARCWFGATVERSYALVGCCVFPEFTRDTFELAQREALLEDHPGAATIIRRLTDPPDRS